MTKKQFIVAVSLVLALAGGAVALFLIFFSQSPSEDEVVATEELSTEDIAAVEVLSSTFLQEATTFGVNMDTITAETASQRLSDVANDNGGTSWIKRAEVAGKLVNENVDLSGGFRYLPERIANADWTDGNTIAGFRTGTLSVDPNTTGSYVYTNRDQPILLATVPFSGSSTLSYFIQSPSAVDANAPGDQENHDADSTPWEIREQTVPVAGTLTLSKEADGSAWRVRGISMDEGEFALPFWAPDQYTTSYPGLELAGTAVRTVDFPNVKEQV